MLSYSDPHFSVGHDLGPIVALLAANFESAKLDGKTITLADRVCSNHQVIDIIHKVSSHRHLSFSFSHSSRMTLFVQVTGRTTIFKSSDGYTPAKDSPIEHVSFFPQLLDI